MQHRKTSQLSADEAAKELLKIFREILTPGRTFTITHSQDIWGGKDMILLQQYQHPLGEPSESNFDIDDIFAEVHQILNTQPGASENTDTVGPS